MILWLPLTGADYAILNLKVVEGDGMIYAPGSRATRGITIEVTDESGRVIPGVAVSFKLPDEGPSGVFVNGGRSDIVTTGEDGRATVWGMRWNKSPGRVNVRITAAKDGVRAGIIATQELDASVAEHGAKAGGGRSRLLMITLVVAGAAGAGVAAGALRGSKSSPAAAAASQTLSVGTPTVIIGAP